jgi:hypothetical protein
MGSLPSSNFLSTDACLTRASSIVVMCVVVVVRRDVVLINRIQEREREGYEEITRLGEKVETRRVRGMTWI